MKYEKYFRDEIFAYTFYKQLASYIKDAEIKEKLLKMAEMEKRHAQFWKSFLSSSISEDLSKIDKIKLKLYILLYKIFGLNIIFKVIELEERSAVKEYYRLYKSNVLDATSQKELAKIIEEEILHENIAEEKNDRTEHIRDIFLGMNDALVEISAALAGLISLYPSNSFLVGITGTIIGTAGALSMSVGNYISVKNQKEVKEQENFEKKILKSLGKKVEIEELKENPWKSAYYTGIFYLIGTIIVVYPYFLGLPTYYAFLLSLASASLTWIIAGIAVGLSSGISLRRKALEMLLTGWGATLLTYLLGAALNNIAGVNA